MPDLNLNRIRILKTGLFAVDRYLNMSKPENVLYFEKLAEPGTHLKLKRVKDCHDDPFRIEVYAPDDRFLGRVTTSKNETAARLMDAGLLLEAIVNESLPVHDSDLPHGMSEMADPKNQGWNETSRINRCYTECNLPYSIYMVDE